MFSLPGSEDQQFHHGALYPDPPHAAFSAAPLDMAIAANAYFPRQGGQDLPTSMASFDNMSMALDGPNSWSFLPMSPPGFSDDREIGLPSNISTASAPSASSSIMGSPRSTQGQPMPIPEWAPHAVNMSPNIVGCSEYFSGTEYSFVPEDLTSFAFPADAPKPPGFIDPSLISPDINRPMMTPFDNGFQQHTPSAQHAPASSVYPNSPALTHASPGNLRNGSQSPFLNANPAFHYPTYPGSVGENRRPSVVSYHSAHSGHSGAFSDSDTKEKQRCPHPECGKPFKDLKAHMLTHQMERPEKCPITNCEYHTKGFARKYDKNRHTLTHYKGTMVCGFCPGSGSAAEKSFNRADVFKRHLTAVHGVEQSPPNSRKHKNGSGAVPVGVGKKPGSDYAPDATGKCSTCSQTFSSVQTFYEHLDDCVMRIVQQEDPTEAINAMRLAEVENDRDVHQTLEKNNLPTTTQTMVSDQGDEDDDLDVDDSSLPLADNVRPLRPVNLTKRKGNPPNGVQKSRGMTHSRGGVPRQNQSKVRKNRKDFPSSWGSSPDQMTMKKRVMALFDGRRRLVKDDMMLSTEHEVRLHLADGNSYVTDLDVQTLKRAEGFHNATEAEKGPWISNDPTEEDVAMMVNYVDHAPPQDEN
ncbi:hypothetical protein BD289DRAFT_459103 [Coniella lustricola]|uniref:C2H2-type domain-containing protein n=1 Tax=Coniella lustricola TaxID=2025994 RepID=A0A2T3AG70_9PEZI|nr:hypothetical protein BD289DRAFT_459103 [Coniella lustricola]